MYGDRHRSVVSRLQVATYERLHRFVEGTDIDRASKIQLVIGQRFGAIRSRKEVLPDLGLRFIRQTFQIHSSTPAEASAFLRKLTISAMITGKRSSIDRPPDGSRRSRTNRRKASSRSHFGSATTASSERTLRCQPAGISPSGSTAAKAVLQDTSTPETRSPQTERYGAQLSCLRGASSARIACRSGSASWLRNRTGSGFDVSR